MTEERKDAIEAGWEAYTKAWIANGGKIYPDDLRTIYSVIAALAKPAPVRDCFNLTDADWNAAFEKRFGKPAPIGDDADDAALDVAAWVKGDNAVQSSIEELDYIAGHETTPLVVAQAALRAKARLQQLSAEKLVNDQLREDQNVAVEQLSAEVSRLTGAVNWLSKLVSQEFQAECDAAALSQPKGTG